MSSVNIEKPDFDSLIKEHIPFTVIPNYVLQNYCDESLVIWCHLLSLPERWKVNRRYLMKKFNVGRDKLNRWLKKLFDHQLIDYVWERCANGKIAQVSLRVRNGEGYKENILNKQQDKSTKLETNAADAHHYTEKPHTGKPAPIKENKRDIKKKEKIKSLCASDDAPVYSKPFIRFWTGYPRKRDKQRTWEIWKRKNLDKKEDVICADVERRKLYDRQWQDIAYVPYPATYAEGDRWEDELTEIRTKKGSNGNAFSEWANGKTNGVTYDEYGNAI